MELLNGMCLEALRSDQQIWLAMDRSEFDLIKQGLKEGRRAMSDRDKSIAGSGYEDPAYEELDQLIEDIESL